MKPAARSRNSVAFTVLCMLFSATIGLSQVTAPEDHLGFKPGADFHLANYEQAIGYFEKIASQSGRMTVLDMGPTSEGRRMKYAVISSEANIENLGLYKEINRKLTLHRGFSEEEARQLADRGRAFVWIDCGLHASECSPAQHAVQLAYDIVSGEDRSTRLIRENVILLLVFANPDGMTLVSDWYMNNVGTKFETSRMPELYQKYAGHDNNRDSFIANLQEIQNMNRATCQEWYPEILYNMHETAPFPARIWMPPESEPMNPNLHPIIVRWKNLIGSAMGKAFEEAGQPGAISRINFDSWYPGYVTQFVDGHNIPSILTETANFRYATPGFYTLRDFPERYRDLTKGVFYPNPWEGGWWRLADAVAYNLTASKAVLETGAKYRYEFLFNKWRVARDVIAQYSNEPPYGWIIPPDQRDPHTTALMIDRFILNGLEIHSADEAFEHNGISHPAGSYLLFTAQPFGLFARNMMEKQDYPDLKKYSHLWQGIVGTAEVAEEPLRAYDGAGWTLPLQMGVQTYEMSRPLDVNKTRIEQAAPPSSGLRGSGPQYVFSHADNGSFIAVNRILEAGGKIACALDGFTLAGETWPVGTFIVDSGSLSSRTLGEIAGRAGISLTGGRASVQTKPLRRNRIALYKSWTASMDAGWISYIFDQYGFKYHFLTDPEVRAGDLRKRFDVIVLADLRARSIIEGNSRGSIHPDYVGGITPRGVENLKEFVESGGVLVCNKGSSDFAIEEFRLPFKDALDGVKPEEFSCPGSILKTTYKSDHPLAFGLPEDGTSYFSRSLAFEFDSGEPKTEEGKEPPAKKGEPEVKSPPDKKSPPRKKYVPEKVKVDYKIVASYPDDPLLLSGWILGDELLRKKAAVLDIDFKRGKLYLFGFNVHNRAQSYSTFKLLFNALIY